MMTTLETKRLIMRNFKTSDWQALQRMIMQYQASEYAVYDHEWPTAENEIQKVTEWFASGDSYWAVCLKNSDQFVGFVSLNEERKGDPGEFNLGYIFDFDYHGKGFATEACRAAISHAFDQFQAKMVVAGTAAANIPSCRLLERLGFQKTAESVGWLRTAKDGHPIEFLGCIYKISKDEWKAADKASHTFRGIAGRSYE